jgi:hypothetical protein
MFRIAVLGPLAADRLGVVRQCIECRAAQGPDAPACPGFGPGCLAPPLTRVKGAREPADTLEPLHSPGSP